jgi:hypothetical protein
MVFIGWFREKFESRLAWMAAALGVQHYGRRLGTACQAKTL